MINKLTMSLESKSTNNESISTSIGYLNTELYSSSDPSVVSTFKTNARNLAININSLTNNTLMNIILKSEENISTAGE